jgi:hypothetical protein
MRVTQARKGTVSPFRTEKWRPARGSTKEHAMDNTDEKTPIGSTSSPRVNTGASVPRYGEMGLVVGV